MKSAKLVKTERKALSKSISTLATATLKILIMIATDYALYWILNLIQYYGRFQSKVQGNYSIKFINEENSTDTWQEQAIMSWPGQTRKCIFYQCST